MGFFNIIGVADGGGLAGPMGVVSILPPWGSNPIFQVVDYGLGQTTTLHLSASGPGVVGGVSVHTSGRTPLGAASSPDSVLDEVLSATISNATAVTGSSVTTYLRTGGHASDAVAMLAASVNGATFVYSAHKDGSGLDGFRANADGSLTFLQHTADTPATYGFGIHALASVTVGSQTFLFSGSAHEDGIDAYQINASGGLTPLDTIGFQQLLPVQGVVAIEPAFSDAVPYLIVASSGSSSLTVLRVQPDGTLLPTDHVTDTLDTRFDKVSSLEVFSHKESVFVLASGADQGMTLMSLLPGGQLIHLETIADTVNFGLTKPSDIQTFQAGSLVNILTTSEIESGVSQFSIDFQGFAGLKTGHSQSLNGTGQDDILLMYGSGAISGAAGNDILRDGAGGNTLTGGAGRDVFVLTADGATDRIEDYAPGQDRIDLSFLPFLRNSGQLTIDPTSNGATIRFADERLEVRSASGAPLTASDFQNMNIGATSRFQVSLGTQPPAGVTLTGGAQNDVLKGSAGDETFAGQGGDDLMISGGGSDDFQGGAGIDTVSYLGATAGIIVRMSNPSQNAGDAADDTFSSIEGISGTAFADLLYGTNGNDILQGEGGADFLDGGLGDDLIRGGDGDDSVLGRAGNDTLYGGAGNDNISAYDGNDTVFGEAGDDLMGGGYGDDTLYGGTGNDTIGSGPGTDVISAGDGHDVASGGYGADLVTGGAGNDTLAGSYGNDIVRGEAGNDSMGGGTGRDQMFGGSGHDAFGGGDDDDHIFGEAGNDFLGGGAGNDALDGGAGNDTLNGGLGNDILTGGGGSDVFVFNSLISGEIDSISDFQDGIDQIRLHDVNGVGSNGRFAALAISDSGAGAVEIAYDGHLIAVPGVSSDIFDVGDFIFV